MLRQSVVLSLVVGLAATAGWAIRDAQAKPMWITGRAIGGQDQVSVEGPDGTYYAVPLDTVFWRDSQGAIHGGHPDCVPTQGQTRTLRIAAVNWAVDVMGSNAVVFVQCGND